MAAPYYALERKVELAIKALLDAVDLDGVPVYIGSNTQDETEEGEQGMRVPYVIVGCSEGTPDMEGQIDGVYVMPARVEVFTHRHDEPGAAHGDRVATIRDALLVDDLSTQLSDAAEDFHCFTLRSSTIMGENEGTHYKATLLLDLVCAAADF